jgi:polyisoprenoid-binding protein YceI
MTESATQAPGTRDFEGVILPTPGTFDLDPAHTRVGFTARHMMISKVRGRFAEFTGSINVAEDPLQSTAEAAIEARSIDTGQPQRDGHLVSPDFLNVEKWPQLTFRSLRVTGHDRNVFTVAGELTIRDVTREVELTLEIEGVANSPYGKQVLGFTLTTEINREDFGMTWNAVVEGGGVMVGKTVKIEIEGEAIRRD